MLTLPLALPLGHADSRLILSLSGGKDSTATLLTLRESGISASYVFADTGWEVPLVYDYLAEMERLLNITIDRVGVPGGFRALALQHGILPHGKTAWCSRDLKVKVLQRYHAQVEEREGVDTVSVVGIRNEESAARAKIDQEFEYSDRWGGYVYRPLLRATVEEVLSLHHRHGVPLNPLYKLGFSRVGCAPCRNANKTDLRLWVEHFPERIDAVRDLERDVSAVRGARGHDGPTTFFLSTNKVPIGIDEAVAWSRTTRGGRQLPLLRDDPDGGCFRWGMCEPPTREADDMKEDSRWMASFRSTR